MNKLFIFFIVIFLLSCQETSKHKIQKEILQWQGKEIKFPDNMVFTKFAKDTILYEYQNHQNKVLVYVDSLGCIPCKLELETWKLLIKELDLISKKRLDYIFYFANKKPKEIEMMLRSEDFDFPVVVDEKNQLNKLNNFSDNEIFHYFCWTNKTESK